MNTRDSALTKIDKHILRVLQNNGRTTYAELSRKVGLGATPCMERVRKLEKKGIIQGYRASVNPDVLDAALMVFVQIRVKRSPRSVFDEFRIAAANLPEVEECYLVCGDFDYLIKARVADMDAYRHFYGKSLLTLPGVLECASYVVMEQVKETRAVPVDNDR